MLSLLFGFLCGFLAISLLGIGFSLLLSSGRRSLGFAAALAPVTGFIFVTILGTYLTALDVPVSRWTVPVLLAGVAVNLLLILLRRAPGIAAIPERRGVALWGIGGFVFTLAVIVAPQMIGGLQFSTLRGNGADAFNYVAAANYLDREPFSWALHVDSQTLVNRDRSYVTVPQLLTSRWSAPMMLAFSSRLAQEPPYRFEYCFSLLCFLMAYGPAFYYACLLGLHARYAAISATVICVGFWAQIILDVRAQSQLNSIPVLLVLMLLIASIENEPDIASWTDYALIGLATLSLLFFYPEIVPTAAAAILIYFVPHLRLANFRSQLFRGYAVAASIALAGCVPLWKTLSRFAIAQFAYASTGKNTWHLAYFAWLYANPPAGLWGFGPLESSGTTLSLLTSAAASVLGSILTIAWVIATVHSVRKGGPALRLAACVSAAATLEFAYLAARGRLWAAAKGLSFGYAFIVLCLAGYYLAKLGANKIRSRAWLPIMAPSVITFLIAQTALGLWRPATAAWNRDYPHYIANNGCYRRHVWDLSAIQSVFSGQKGVTVWMSIADGSLLTYLEFALGSEVKLIDIGSNVDVTQVDAPLPRPLLPPQYILTESAALDTSVSNIVARTPELVLLAANPNSVILASVINPNGLDRTPRDRFFWMGGKPTTFAVISSTETCARFSARATLGPSSSLLYRTLLVKEGSFSPAESVTRGGTISWQVPVHAGLNRVTVSIKEAATQFAPRDPRPLLMGIEGLRAESATCAASCR